MNQIELTQEQIRETLKAEAVTVIDRPLTDVEDALIDFIIARVPQARSR